MHFLREERDVIMSFLCAVECSSTECHIDSSMYSLYPIHNNACEDDDCSPSTDTCESYTTLRMQYDTNRDRNI